MSRRKMSIPPLLCTNHRRRPKRNKQCHLSCSFSFCLRSAFSALRASINLYAPTSNSSRFFFCLFNLFISERRPPLCCRTILWCLGLLISSTLSIAQVSGSTRYSSAILTFRFLTLSVIVLYIFSDVANSGFILGAPPISYWNPIARSLQDASINFRPFS